LGINRLQKLRQALEQQESDALLVSQSENRRYFSEFTGSAGWLVISVSNALLAVDFRYVEQAKNESAEFEIVHINGEITNWLPQLASEAGIKRLGFEANEIPFAIYRQLYDALSNDYYQIKFIPTTNLVESVRAIKEPEELEFITAAAELADSAFEHTKSMISPGITEKEIAWHLEKFLREKGSETIPFEIIVASGPNSALPHAKPSKRVILHDEPIIIDMGAKVNGYCSDLSRTLCFGKGDETFSKTYNIVLGAQLTAIATIDADMNGDQADQLARKVIDHAGYGNSFGHGLGHGIGLAAHESPRLGPNASDLLVNGMVFTVEPGIYISGWGGIRIEDTVVMEKGKIKTLTCADKTANI
jgi:Xaa-Pro aminopeptidase